MAAPTNPTANSIVSEALTRFLNGGTPTATEITRGENFGLEKVKRDIMNVGKTWGPLIRTDYIATKVGVSQYANPSDFEGYKEVSLMIGNHSGGLGTVVSAKTMDLGAGEDAVKAEIEGKFLFISAGTGVNQCEQIDDYAGVRVTLRDSFGTLPVTADAYLVVNRITPLGVWNYQLFGLIEYGSQPAKPTRYAEIPSDTTGFICLNPVPESVYGLKRTYYADLMLVDVSIDLYDTILRRWAGVFEQGVYVWALGQDDDRYKEEKDTYDGMLLKLAIHDLDGFTPPEQK